MNVTLEHIWQEFSAKLGRFIRARVTDASAAEDILQDVFVKIQKRVGDLRDPAKLQGWLYLIARNSVIDYYRTRKETEDLPDTLVAESDGDDAEVKELNAAFLRMIYNLPEPYREALVLTVFDGLTQHQVAARLGISLAGAKSRVQRGRQQLKQMLNECCTFEFDRRGQVIACQRRRAANCQECG